MKEAELSSGLPRATGLLPGQDGLGAVKLSPLWFPRQPRSDGPRPLWISRPLGSALGEVVGAGESGVLDSPCRGLAHMQAHAYLMKRRVHRAGVSRGCSAPQGQAQRWPGVRWSRRFSGGTCGIHPCLRQAEGTGKGVPAGDAACRRGGARVRCAEATAGPGETTGQARASQGRS